MTFSGGHDSITIEVINMFLQSTYRKRIKCILFFNTIETDITRKNDLRFHKVLATKEEMIEQSMNIHELLRNHLWSILLVGRGIMVDSSDPFFHFSTSIGFENFRRFCLKNCMSKQILEAIYCNDQENTKNFKKTYRHGIGLSKWINPRPLLVSPYTVFYHFYTIFRKSFALKTRKIVNQIM